MFTLEYYSDIIFRVSPYYKEDQFVRKKCVDFGDEVNQYHNDTNNNKTFIYIFFL